MKQNKSQQMDDAKLGAYLDAQLRNTIGFGTGDSISAERKKALDYYLNNATGDEEDGRSKLQDSTVHDVVEAFLPGLLAPFISTDTICEFKPTEESDEELADVQTKYINHIMMVDNDGVNLLYTFAKDGLLQKNGFIYADWSESEHSKLSTIRTSFYGLQELQGESTVSILEIVGFHPDNSPMQPQEFELGAFDQNMAQFEVKFRRTVKEGRVKIRNIPPEFTLVSNTATTVDNARVIGWQEQVTVSQLRDEGYDEDLIEGIKTAESDTQSDTSGERATRVEAQGGYLTSQNGEEGGDPASRLVWRTVIWVRVDYDGDGYAELRKIVRAGEKQTGGKILYNEESDFVPLVTFTPIPMPHQLFGRSFADQAFSIQDGKTALLRCIMNGVYDTVEPRWLLKEASMSSTTWEDLMLREPGTGIRVEEMDAIQRLNDAPNTGAAYQMMEQFDRMAERRTPVTRQMQAVDPDSLNTTTATEAQIQQNASAQRQELVLRLFAEAVGRLCKNVLKIAIKHQDKPRMLRLMPKMPAIEIDPRTWDVEMDVSVKVGLGTGTKSQQMNNLMMISNIQMQDMQMGLPTVDPEKLYNTRAQIVNFAGLSTPELYFNDPKQAQEQAPQEAPAPDPAQQQQEAQQIEQAIQGAREQGKQEGIDMLKMEEIKSKERMHGKDADLKAAELQLRGTENQFQAAGYRV